jgi:hypothetical protein
MTWPLSRRLARVALRGVSLPRCAVRETAGSQPGVTDGLPVAVTPGLAFNWISLWPHWLRNDPSANLAERAPGGHHRVSRLGRLADTWERTMGSDGERPQAVVRAEEAQRRARSARERAREAKRRELAAYERAIKRHEEAAEVQERFGHPDRAADARDHARRARELRELALREQREWEAQNSAAEDQPAKTP